MNVEEELDKALNIIKDVVKKLTIDNNYLTKENKRLEKRLYEAKQELKRR